MIQMFHLNLMITSSSGERYVIIAAGLFVERTFERNLDLYSLSGRTSYCRIWWRLKAASFGLDFSNHSKIWKALRKQRFKMPVKFQNDTVMITPEPAAFRRHEISP